MTVRKNKNVFLKNNCRLLHHSTVINIKGNSYRLKDRSGDNINNNIDLNE